MSCRALALTGVVLLCLSAGVMAEILQPRATEIFCLIHDEVCRAGFERALNAGVVLSGGGSLLPGMIEVCEQVFDTPVRLGQPSPNDGAQDADSRARESGHHGGELCFWQFRVLGQVRDSMGDLGARRCNQVMKDQCCSVSIRRCKRAHHAVQVRLHDALRPAKVL